MSVATKAYDRLKDQARERNARIARDGRNIGGLPVVGNVARRVAAAASLRLWCETYYPRTFCLPWSQDHRDVIAEVEQCVRDGGLFANAMPRGSGKTSICESAALWSELNGYRDFIGLIGADEDKAGEMLESIKAELEGNALLAEDFPEVCVPVAKLEGIANRCSGQLYDDKRTHIEWTAKAVVLPTVRPVGWLEDPVHRQFVREDGQSLASGAIIRVAGLTGGIRGMKHKRADGRSVRPGLVIIDDPQTDASARSRSQCETRERILAGAVLGLAGPGAKIAAVMPCTVISAGDMADNILDRDKHPKWNGKRTRMVYRFPADEKLWEEYHKLRDEGLRAGDAGRAATEFYREHREAMDAGAVVAWPARYNHDELSAVQHAMNFKLDNERAFWAEGQNQPQVDAEAFSDDLTPDHITSRLNRQPRGKVATSCNRLTAFVDVHASLLYWVVAGWEDDFTGAVVDYGVFPDQKRDYFTLRDAKHGLCDVVKGAGLEGQIYGGLELLASQILGHEWRRDDGATLKIERCLIDANWGTSTAVVKRFCRQSEHSAVLTPSHGKYIGASSLPMGEWRRSPGDRVGPNWRIRSMEESKSVRSVLFDTNFWKSFVFARLSAAMGDRGSLTLFGDKPQAHQLFADHLCAEHRVRTEGRGRTVDEWKWRPERFDNHWWDCLTGCAVAASVQGVVLPQTAVPKAKKRERLTFEQLQQRRTKGA